MKAAELRAFSVTEPSVITMNSNATTLRCAATGGTDIIAKGSSAVILPAEAVQAILTKDRQIMPKLDKMKATLVNEDSRKVLKRGSSEL